MIEGCIVAKLVLGYLTDEGFHRTCSAFQDECSLFHGGNSELDQVLLTADLKTILEDYSQLKEKGRENGIPTSSAVLKSLWKDLDVVIGQLKYATIPTGAPKLNSMGSQATRTRRLNIGRSRRNMLQKNQQHAAKTVTNPPSIPCLSTPSLPENNANEKLPLPRVSTAGVAHNTVANGSQLPSANRRAPSVVQSTANKDVNIRPTSSITQPVGGAVPVSVPVMPCNDQLTGTPGSCLPSTAPSAGNSCTNNEQSRNTDATDGMFDVMDDVDVYNDGDLSHSGADQPSTQTAPVIVIDDASSQNQHVVDVEEHSSSSSNLSQQELQLRSPKRKGVQPKKRVPQSVSGISAVHDSPIKPVPWSANQEVETDIVCAPDSLTPESFLGTLLSTPLLQEKLAENINKVVSSSRVQPASDEQPSAAPQSMTTTEASSDDVLMASNQEVGGDIPVKEIMDLMQADPAFDVLFSFFGLDALNALPSATNSSTELSEKPADSNHFGKSTSSLSTSESQLQDTLGALPSLATGTVSDFGNGITILPGSNQQLHMPCSASDFRDGNTTLQVSNQQPLEQQGSSSASGLHLSATSIVTDALLLLAGSPQKKASSQVTSQLNYCTNHPVSGQHNPGTSSSGAHSIHRSPDKQPCRQSTINQPALITSTLPYVRALKFSEGNETVPRKRGRKKGSKNKNEQKQNTKIKEQSKTPANKKGANNGRQRIIAKKPPEPTATSFSKSASCSTFANTISISKPLATYAGTLNRTSLPHLSPGNVMMPNSSPNPAPDSFVNCLPDSTPQPLHVISSSPSPVGFTDAAACPLVLPANHFTMVTSAALSSVSFNNSSICPTPTPVNFTPSSSVHIPSPFTLHDFPICSPPVSLPTTDQPNSPSVVPVVCPIPSSASLAPLNVSAISDKTLVTQAVNTVTLTNSTGLRPAVTPGHYTDSRVSSATAVGVGNLTTSVEDSRIMVSSGLGPSMSRETVDAGADDLSTSSEPLSLQASNLLQTLALKHANSQTNVAGPCNLVSGSNNEQIGAEGLRNNDIPHSAVVEVACQPLKENSTSLENMNVSKENIDKSSKKHSGHDSSSLNAMEQELRETVPGETSLKNSLENMNDSTSSLAMLNQECSELMKENSAGFSNSQTNGERGVKGSSNPARKRQRDSIHLQKKKRSKSSRPSKRSKTQEEGINFPSDLNVEEFLAKLHYERK